MRLDIRFIQRPTYETIKKSIKGKPTVEKRNLKTEQPALWRRLRALSSVYLALGLALILARPTSAHPTVMEQLINLHGHGVIFLILGLVLFISKRFWQHDYRFTRNTISAILAYSSMWLMALLYQVFVTGPSFVTIVLFAYITWTALDVLRDPGFAFSALIRKAKANQ